MENMVTLYIGKHNTTGLKYFGKSAVNFNIQDLLKYGGSGKYWRNHLKKHGKDISMEIYGIFHKDEVKEIALKFSKDNNIVKALNENGKKIWANENPENGLDGCPKGLKRKPTSKETKLKLSKALMGRPSPAKGTTRSKEAKEKTSRTLKETLSNKETRDKMSERQLGSNNSSAKRIQLFDNNNKLIVDVTGGFTKYLKDNNMPSSISRTYRNNSKISRGKYKGWYARIK